MTRLPRWEDAIGSACEEAAVPVGRGLDVRPTLYGFEDGQPTLRVQAGLRALHERRHEVPALLVALVPILGIRQVMLFSHARTTDPDITDPDLQAALATHGITVEVGERHGDEVTVAAHLLDRHLDGDQVRWSDPEPVERGIWSAVLRHALSLDGPVGDDAPALTCAYALSRWGVVVEVAPGWRERYGFSRLPPRPERDGPLDRPPSRPPPRARPQPSAHGGVTSAAGAEGNPMTAPITWRDHETWFAAFLEPLDEAAPTPLLVCFTDGTADRIVDSRRERHGDEVDPLTELAVIAAELRPDACVIALPMRLSDLQAADRPTVARAWSLTSAVRRGRGVDLRVRQLPVGGVGSASDLDVEVSPVASVLDDAARHRLGEDVDHALYTVCRWGHTIYALGLDDHAAGGSSTVHLGPGASRDADGARHRLQRHARDLAARHRPLGGWEQVFDRPAVHADTPDGWVAACPL